MSYKRLTHTELLERMRDLFDACITEAQKKNADYAQQGKEGTSGLSNFYETATRLNITPLQAWAVHYEKHILAIEQLASGRELRSETMLNRFTDLINYPALGYLLAQELLAEKEHLEKDQQQQQPQRIETECLGKYMSGRYYLYKIISTPVSARANYFLYETSTGEICFVASPELAKGVVDALENTDYYMPRMQFGWIPLPENYYLRVQHVPPTNPPR